MATRRRAARDAAAAGGPADGALADDVGGPDATVRATARALAKIDEASALMLVEGILDQVALETAAAGRGLDLEAQGIVITPIGGAHAIGRFLADLGPRAARVRLTGLCDLREADLFRRAVSDHFGSAHTAADMESRGFFVCDRDLEDELIRALGTTGVEALLDDEGDLALFRAFQNQPAWRGRQPEAQLYRFLRSSARRNLRYARLLVDAASARDALPRPLGALLTAAS
ncbi:TOPRIM nucleotidyl transferase/hydrolase domain-containing protein [Catellatospora bangladeshensis]|uniref:OLD protein-like TOPRIM domain-containing protein n=1 Tax=Catellatospora bangladeshensis TaxID=310355 RepID=A0A8J3JQA2_9ACTN|nr:TOPRIM nucleotidyl transferase/hydrolase domain-containing protein [Catellatospora bangladeshensis]GIF82863.1 hypothetical protein Cba03nite_42120 [Catellatospora bangladeshensis]